MKTEQVITQQGRLRKIRKEKEKKKKLTSLALLQQHFPPLLGLLVLGPPPAGLLKAVTPGERGRRGWALGLGVVLVVILVAGGEELGVTDPGRGCLDATGDGGGRGVEPLESRPLRRDGHRFYRTRAVAVCSGRSQTGYTILELHRARPRQGDVTRGRRRWRGTRRAESRVVIAVQEYVQLASVHRSCVTAVLHQVFFND